MYNVNYKTYQNVISKIKIGFLTNKFENIWKYLAKKKKKCLIHC